MRRDSRCEGASDGDSTAWQMRAVPTQSKFEPLCRGRDSALAVLVSRAGSSSPLRLRTLLKRAVAPTRDDGAAETPRDDGGANRVFHVKRSRLVRMSACAPACWQLDPQWQSAPQAVRGGGSKRAPGNAAEDLQGFEYAATSGRLPTGLPAERAGARNQVCVTPSWRAATVRLSRARRAGRQSWIARPRRGRDRSLVLSSTMLKPERVGSERRGSDAGPRSSARARNAAEPSRPDSTSPVFSSLPVTQTLRDQRPGDSASGRSPERPFERLERMAPNSFVPRSGACECAPTAQRDVAA